jgi:cytoskeletal protein CcmA (bactofilin family)
MISLKAKEPDVQVQRTGQPMDQTKRQNRMKKMTKHLSILDKECSVEGTIIVKGQLVVRGQVTGKLVAQNVVIAEEGVVYAEAEVQRMTVGGKFEGYVQAAGELVILSTGHCSGKIVCKDFVVEPGGVLNAEVNCLVAGTSKSVNSPLQIEDKN